MKIVSLHLENYRCFENFDIDFDPELTVLVGVNGSGKTALLDALAVFLKIAIDKTSKNLSLADFGLAESDTRVGKNNEAVKLCLEVSICEHPEHNRRVPIDSSCIPSTNNLASEKISQKQRSCAKKEICTVKKIGLNALRQFFSVKEIQPKQSPRNCFYSYRDGIPALAPSQQFAIAAYYSAQRCLPKQLTATPLTGKNSAFSEAFDANINFNTTLKWFEDKDAEEARDFRDNPDIKDYQNPILQAVRGAVALALGDGESAYEFPRMKGSNPAKLFIKHKETGVDYEATMLSDGYRTMLALVMDLARRMAVANEHVEWEKEKGETVLHSPGIVLIDEVELHLHPAWQQTVLPTLTKIFPKTQFIVTTHSPQVLTSIRKEHIRLLGVDDQQAIIPDDDTGTYGAESSRVLAEIFGTNPRPPQADSVENLREYWKLLEARQESTPRAKELRHDLEKDLGPQDSDLMRADVRIAQLQFLGKK